jgi:hypothetical protein
MKVHWKESRQGKRLHEWNMNHKKKMSLHVKQWSPRSHKPKNASENRLLLNRPKNTKAIIVPRNGLFWNNQRNATASRSESTECTRPWDPLGYGKKEELKQSKEKGLSQIWRGNGVDATEEKKVLIVRTSPATLVGNTLSFTSLPDRFRKRRNESKRNHNKSANKARNSVLEKTHKKWTQREFAIGNSFPPVQVPIIASKCRSTPPPRT